MESDPIDSSFGSDELRVTATVRYGDIPQTETVRLSVSECSANQQPSLTNQEISNSGQQIVASN